jgi:hypothetical protein
VVRAAGSWGWWRRRERLPIVGMIAWRVDRTVRSGLVRAARAGLGRAPRGRRARAGPAFRRSRCSCESAGTPRCLRGCVSSRRSSAGAADRVLRGCCQTAPRSHARSASGRARDGPSARAGCAPSSACRDGRRSLSARAQSRCGSWRKALPEHAPTGLALHAGAPCSTRSLASSNSAVIPSAQLWSPCSWRRPARAMGVAQGAPSFVR